TFTVKRAPPAPHLINRLPFTVLFPLTFWLMGTVVILFLRPRDERWQVLVLFSYVNALWIASGLASEERVAGSGVVFHAVIWLFMPLALHLHLILPNALTRKRLRIVGPLYAVSVVVAVLDNLHLLSDLFEYYTSFTIGVLGSFSLLLARLVLRAPA